MSCYRTTGRQRSLARCVGRTLTANLRLMIWSIANPNTYLNRLNHDPLSSRPYDGRTQDACRRRRQRNRAQPCHGNFALERNRAESEPGSDRETLPAF
jgi:hypothetical protein